MTNAGFRRSFVYSHTGHVRLVSAVYTVRARPLRFPRKVLSALTYFAFIFFGSGGILIV